MGGGSGGLGQGGGLRGGDGGEGGCGGLGLGGGSGRDGGRLGGLGGRGWGGGRGGRGEGGLLCAGSPDAASCGEGEGGEGEGAGLGGSGDGGEGKGGGLGGSGDGGEGEGGSGTEARERAALGTEARWVETRWLKLVFVGAMHMGWGRVKVHRHVAPRLRKGTKGGRRSCVHGQASPGQLIDRAAASQDYRAQTTRATQGCKTLQAVAAAAQGDVLARIVVGPPDGGDQRSSAGCSCGQRERVGTCARHARWGTRRRAGPLGQACKPARTEARICSRARQSTCIRARQARALTGEAGAGPSDVVPQGEVQ